MLYGITASRCYTVLHDRVMRQHRRHLDRNNFLELAGGRTAPQPKISNVFAHLFEHVFGNSSPIHRTRLVFTLVRSKSKGYGRLAGRQTEFIWHSQ